MNRGRPQESSSGGRRRYAYWVVTVVVLALLGGGLYHLSVVDSERRASYALWERASELIGSAKSSEEKATVAKLFGNDVDGICVFANGFPGYATTDDLSKLPRPFSVALQRNSRKLMQQSKNGYDFIYSIRDERIVETYVLPFSGHIFVWYVNENEYNRDVMNACFGKNDVLRIVMNDGPDGVKLGIGFTSKGYEL